MTVNSIAKVCTTIGMMYQLVLSLQTTITSHHQNSKWGKLFQWISKRIVVIIVVVGSLSHSLAPNWMRSRSLMYDMSWMRGQAIVLFALNFIFMLHLLYNGPMECPLPFCRDEILRAKVSSRRTKDLGAPFQFVNRFIIYGVIKSVFKEQIHRFHNQSLGYQSLIDVLKLTSLEWDQPAILRTKAFTSQTEVGSWLSA